jgi:hypothetical protein
MLLKFQISKPFLIGNHEPVSTFSVCDVQALAQFIPNFLSAAIKPKQSNLPTIKF